MKELYILDEPGTKGHAYVSGMTRAPGENWRKATRRERFVHELHVPRLSIWGFLWGAAVYAALVYLADWLT